MSLFETGDERYKATIHGLALVLSGAACVVHLEMAHYNETVYRRHGTRWHRFSAAVYGSVVLLEVIQIARHLRNAAS